jgi:hypothetical protein
MCEQVVFRNYFVAYVDLVGQRDALRRMSSLPTTPEETKEFLTISQNSLGKVLNVRAWFRKYFDATKRPVSDLPELPPQLRGAVWDIRSGDCSVYSLSDAIVIAVPLYDDFEHCKGLNGIVTALFAICGMAAVAFAAGVALRGGLDIGIATSIDGKEVYGPALVRAYALESQAAEYPRFVVGGELVQFLDAVRSQKPQTGLGGAAKRLAARCRALIVQDTDGRQMADFLVNDAKDTLGLPPEVFSRGHDFVLGEYEAFRKSGNEKLASRYYRLLQYYLARRRIWDA